MSNGIRIRGLSGDVSNVSVQSSVARTWALLGRKWAGLRWRTHDVSLERDEVLVLKCQGGDCRLELEGLGGSHGSIVVQEDVSRLRIRAHERRSFALRQGVSLVLTTEKIVHPLHKHGPIIET
jgi:hypothetical protein